MITKVVVALCWKRSGHRISVIPEKRCYWSACNIGTYFRSVLEYETPPKGERNTDLAVISLQGKFFINLLDDKCVHVFFVRFKTESDNR